MKGVTRRLRLLAFWVLIFLLPHFTHAQVSINEIMYNPKGSDTGREWIELYNAGGTDVTMVAGSGKGAWKVNDGSNHNLVDPASGTGRGALVIPAGGYLLVSNDPTNFISGEYAGGSYSVIKSSISLNNTGTTVSLIDGTGTTVDSATYTNASGGSDDGTSLQKQADGSWIAALPTPGAANSLVPYVPPSTDTSSDSQTSDTTDQTPQASTTTTSSQNTSVAESSYVAPPTPSLFADAGADRTVIVGADVEFDAQAYDKDQESLDPSTVRFSWNFGDGGTAEGQSVLHHFVYPGRYAVMLDIAQNKSAVSDEAIVTAEPAALSFLVLPDGGVEVDNNAGHDLDLSDWIVRQDAGTFAAQFMLPDHSTILSGSSIKISAQTLSFRAASSTMLEYPNGVLALAAGATTAPAPAPTPASSPTVNAPNVPSTAKTFSVAADAVSDPVTDGSDAALQTDAVISSDSAATDTIATTSAEAAAAAGARASSSRIWWLAALGLAVLAAVSLIIARRLGKGEWDIVEEK